MRVKFSRRDGCLPFTLRLDYKLYLRRIRVIPDGFHTFECSSSTTRLPRLCLFYTLCARCARIKRKKGKMKKEMKRRKVRVRQSKVTRGKIPRPRRHASLGKGGTTRFLLSFSTIFTNFLFVIFAYLHYIYTSYSAYLYIHLCCSR